MNEVIVDGTVQKIEGYGIGENGVAYNRFTMQVEEPDSWPFLVTCTALGKAADTLAEKVRLGDRVMVAGSVITYEDPMTGDPRVRVLVEDLDDLSAPEEIGVFQARTGLEYKPGMLDLELFLNDWYDFRNEQEY